ncbi:MAG: hypothetical protein ACFNZR_00500 [Candidatus Nanosynbacter sp.]
MRVKQTSPKKTKIVIISLVSAVIVIAIAAAVYAITRPQQTEQAKNDVNSSQTKEKNNSKGDSKKVDDSKTKPEEQDGRNSDRPAGPGEQRGSKRAVTPIVSGYGLSGDKQRLQIDGGVNAIVENGGSCTFTVYWSGGQASRQTGASAGPSSTNCRMAEIPLSELPSGTDMSVKVVYSSGAYTGESTNGPSFRKEGLQ